MKITKNYIVVFLFTLLWHLSSVAQYTGGDASGAATENLSNTICGIPAHFNAYFGGDNDTASVDELSNTLCGFPPSFYAYMGGEADTAAVDELSATVCGIPPSFFAYMGGDNDQASTDELMVNICPFPPSFYAYFGGDGSGFVLDKTAPVCPTQPPVANFTASATEICVGQSVTFTDTSTNIPSGWAWTFAGGTPTTSTDQNPVVSYATAGTYAVTLTAANYNGTNTVTQTGFITVNGPTNILTRTDGSRCGPGTVTLTATSNNGIINWYADPTGGASLATGNSFTPSITVSTPFYVESSNSCYTSQRLLVFALNRTPSTPIANSASRCGSGSVNLSISTGAVDGVRWYNVPTGGTVIANGGGYNTPSLTTTTSYYAESFNGSCVSTRVEVIATINPIASITSTTPGFVCDFGPVTLGATTAAGTINWYNVASGGSILGTGTSFTTPNLSVSAIYYVEVVNGTCTSARASVVASVYPTPLITSTTQLTPICVSGSTTLRATSNYNGTETWQWFDAATGGNVVSTSNTYVTPVLSVDTTYYVAVSRFGCTSPRTAITATITATPTIVSTTPAGRCGTGSVALSAAASAGNITWWNAPIGGSNVGSGATFNTPSIATTTTYYVQTTNNTCVSARTAVVATITSAPTITATSPASRCDSGTVILGATASAGTLNWYATSTGGTSIGSGSSFTTPNISATTTYYVGANDGTCSSARTAVTASVGITPTILSVTPRSRCDAGTVTLSASCSVGNIVWFADATGGTALFIGNNFETPSISVATTYYFEAVNGTCSTTRTAIVAGINISPTITTTTAATICAFESFTISATQSTGTVIRWFNVPTGGIVQGTGNSFSLNNWSTTTTFYAEAVDGSCLSPRVPVVVTVNQRPSNLTAVGASRCGTGTLSLTATYTIGTINWYDAVNGGNLVFTGSNFVTPSLSNTVTYYVEASNGTCTSTSRTAVTATVNAIPGITAIGNNSRCGTGSVSLSAAASAGNVVWYAAATGGTALATANSYATPSLSVTTTYYVEAVNGTCASTTRTAVVATIDTLPTITATNPASQCGSGSFVLNATSSGTMSWFANSTGGTALATGSSFTTPTINATTIYYVASTNGTCTTSRTAVTATITNEPAPIGTANQSFCANETVGQLVTTGTNVNWYATANSTAILPNNTPLVSGVTYYATQTISGCESNTRLAVTVITGDCLGNETYNKLSGLKLYPNPVIDLLTVIYSDTISKIEITNMLGQYIDNYIINANETQVDMSRLSTGTYLIKVTANDISETFKVIKK